MNFDADYDHPSPTASLSPREYWKFCEEVMRKNPRLRPETCMETEDDERWMDAPFSLDIPMSRVAEPKRPWPEVPSKG